MSRIQRLNRTSVLDQRVGHGRLEGERTPTYRGELLHKREDFGTSMDDTQYSEMRAGQDKFNKDIASARSKIASAESQASSAYASEQSNISSQRFNAGEMPGTYDQYVDQQVANGDWVSIRVYNEGRFISTNYLPKSSADDYINQVSSGGGNAWIDDGRYGVDTQGYSREIHAPIIIASQNARKEYDASVAAYKDQVDQAHGAFNTSRNSALSVLDTQYASAQEGIASQRRQVDSMVKSNQDQLNTIRNKYSQKMGSVKNTISEMFKARMEE